jgi:hypothetical protein
MLKPGIIINRLNDVPLRGDPLSVWSKALLEEDVSATQDAGFCIPNTLLFSKQDITCGTVLDIKIDGALVLTFHPSHHSVPC